MSTLAPHPDAVVYPDSDGKPMAENTLQYEWIVMIRENIADRYAAAHDVFVAADNLIYPVRGDATVCIAPDVYVAFGRPPGHRGSYKVWEEGDIFPQVIFEVRSPGNRGREMDAKRQFYRRHGAEEYYVIDPTDETVEAWVRDGNRFVGIDDISEHTSPRLGIRFESSDSGLALVWSDGSRFRTFHELRQERDEQAARADAEKKRADAEKRRADAEKKRADAEAASSAKLDAKLRELGVDPEAV